MSFYFESVAIFVSEMRKSSGSTLQPHVGLNHNRRPAIASEERSQQFGSISQKYWQLRWKGSHCPSRSRSWTSFHGHSRHEWYGRITQPISLWWIYRRGWLCSNPDYVLEEIGVENIGNSNMYRESYFDGGLFSYISHVLLGNLHYSIDFGDEIFGRVHYV